MFTFFSNRRSHIGVTVHTAADLSVKEALAALSRTLVKKHGEARWRFGRFESSDVAGRREVSQHET